MIVFHSSPSQSTISVLCVGTFVIFMSIRAGAHSSGVRASKSCGASRNIQNFNTCLANHQGESRKSGGNSSPRQS